MVLWAGPAPYALEAELHIANLHFSLSFLFCFSYLFHISFGYENNLVETNT